ncbi:XRE family transcriptional regulator [Dyadobacter sp. 676]|uniref:XRE family transcriptional regulator n=1 Tax=Dyadobacter sp. 676 TaxID=3088362 RepID=A0AAU8FJY0_9BACT
MDLLFATRFKSARLRSGLSLQDVASRLGNKITRQALHRYEKGEVTPNSEMLGLLSEIMAVRPDYFFRNTRVELGALEYRKLQHLSARDENRIVEQTREYLSRYLELEEILGISGEFINPLKGLGPVATLSDVSAAADLLREKWGLGANAVVNIAGFLEDMHIKVVEIDVDTHFNGMQTWANEGLPVVAYNKNLQGKPDRIRFTLLHELGHLLLQFGDVKDKQKEVLCHQFAGALLMPESVLKEKLGPHRSKLSLHELGNLKRQYGISMQAIVMRAIECKIVSEHYGRQFFKMIEEMGWKSREPVAYEGIERSYRFDRLLFRALAEGQVSMSKAAALKNMKLAEFHEQYTAIA